MNIFSYLVCHYNVKEEEREEEERESQPIVKNYEEDKAHQREKRQQIAKDFNCREEKTKANRKSSQTLMSCLRNNVEVPT